MAHRGPVVVIALFIVLLAQPIAAQTESVDLQVKVAAGEVRYHANSGVIQLSLDIAGQRSSVDAQVAARRAVRVLDVSPDGVMLTEVTLEDFRITTGGRTEEPAESPWTFRVAPDGRIVEKIVGAEGVDDFPISLPGRPVRVGESWTRQTRLTQSGITAQGTGTFTLVAVERSGDARIARIRLNFSGTVTGAPLGPLPPGAEARTSGTMRATGEAQWSVERGWLVRESSDLTIDVQADVTAQGQTGRVRLTLRGTSRHEPLASEDVTVPPISADRLIAPGKGIGPFTFDLPASEFTNRLGEPEPRPGDLGFGAPSVRWPNGLAGFIDPDDQTKIIGLNISERSYRTAKGLKFGSPEGAVLLAYGMTPVKVTMTIPNLGGVRVLIYNEQGIALAITSDAEHARRGPAHAPIGAVDWITVFPPGTAGKIYPMP